MAEAPVLYYSTNLKAPVVSFKEALLKGLAPDGGLYMPQRIPALSSNELNDMAGNEYHEIAYYIMRKFIPDEISDAALRAMTKEAYNYEVPVEPVYERKFILHRTYS